MRRICLCSLALLLLAGFSTATGREVPSADELFYEAKRSYYYLLNLPERQKGHESWLQVVGKYEVILNQYPDFAQADEVLNTVAGLYLDMYRKFGRPPDLNHALSSYHRLCEDYPASRHAEWALFISGELLFRYGKAYAEAEQRYRRLVANYPNGRWTEKAKLRLTELAPHLPGTSSKGASGGDSARISALKVVKGLRYWTNPTYTRVVLDVEDSVTYQQHILRNPDRLYLDLQGTRISPDLNDPVIPINDGLLKRARIGQNQPDRVRVVLDIDNISRHKIFALEEPYRIVIDVMGKKEGRSRGSAAEPPSGMTRREALRGRDIGIARQLGLGVETIVIDPGHGGRDPGAIGPSGIMEKEITLDVAKRLKQLIEKRMGCKVILTRYRDVFLPLEERTAIANTSEADLFISIHVNAHKRPTVSGVETFCLNFASSEDAKITAARENQTSLKKVSDLQAILTDLLLTSKLDESTELARLIQDSLASGLSSRFGRVNNLGVKEAPFYVLIGAQMPSILVEIGFVSNPTEEKRLRASGYRDQVAQHILNGVQQYIDTTRYAYQR